MRRALVTSSIACILFLAACAQDEAPPAVEAEASAAPAAAPVERPEPPIDPDSGLKMAENWELVKATCTACHSAKQVTQQRGTAEQWLSMIRWMQKKQNLWQFDPVTEDKIITYLAENYAPSAAQRRAALSPDLMPPNPYRQ